jgi:hypothetical protein
MRRSSTASDSSSDSSFITLVTDPHLDPSRPRTNKRDR